MADRRLQLAIKRAALLQKEIDLNDPITVGYKQMLTNVLCEKQESSPLRFQSSMNRHARNLISPKIPHNLKFFRTKYPMAFLKDAGFPFYFIGPNGKENVVILNPDVVVYFTQEEMFNIVSKAKNSDLERERVEYSRLVKSAEHFIDAKAKLATRQLHFATLLNLPKYNTYKDMLKANPEYFEKMYRIHTGESLLDKYKD